MEQEYFTPPEIAKRLRVEYTTVMRWIRTGALEAETIQQGKHNRHCISKANLAAMVITQQMFYSEKVPPKKW